MPSDKLLNTQFFTSATILGPRAAWHGLVAACMLSILGANAQTVESAQTPTPEPAPAAINPAPKPASQPQPGYGFAPTVQALLEADAQKALNQALGKKSPSAPAIMDEPDSTQQPQPRPSAKPPKAPQQQLSLLGIYGRPGAWNADVAINGVSVLLARDQSYLGWTVDSVDGRCVSLRSSKDKRTLCGVHGSGHSAPSSRRP